MSKHKWELTVSFEAVDVTEAMDIIRAGDCFPYSFHPDEMEKVTKVGLMHYRLSNGVTTIETTFVQPDKAITFRHQAGILNV